MKGLPVSPLAPPPVRAPSRTHWMTWSTGWILNQARFLTKPSNISQRSARKTSGLFNEGLAGDAPLGTASDTKPSAEDVVSAVDAGNDVSMWGLDDFSLSDVLGPDGDPMGETSLDSFMDLSAYLMENTANGTTNDSDFDTKMPMSLQKESFVELETVELVNVKDEVVIAMTSDHDYVSKKLRLSSVEESSETGSMDATCVETKPTFTKPVTPQVKYRQRRDKNNVASRRSREIRKQKYNEMDVQAEQLIIDNEKLKVRIVELEKLAKEMKNILVSKMVGK